MRLVNTKRWLVQPKSGYFFRVENEFYVCHFKIWHYALISKKEINA